MAGQEARGLGSFMGMMLIPSCWEKGIFPAQKGKLRPEGLLLQTPPRPAFFLVTLKQKLEAASWLSGQCPPLPKCQLGL